MRFVECKRKWQNENWVEDEEMAMGKSEEKGGKLMVKWAYIVQILS